MRKNFLVLTASSENSAAQPRPLKKWFREAHSTAVVPGMTSHGMRDYMKRKLHWKVIENATQVLIVDPSLDDSVFLDYLGCVSGDDVGAKELDNDGETMSSDQAKDSTLFALESHLRDFLAHNLNSAIQWNNHLTLIDTEYHTSIGFIDLLARDTNGDFVVFEFKLDRGPDAALGQLLRYMAWCSRHLVKEANARVHGVILAADITDKLRYAASMVPSVHLFEYQLQFTARPVGLENIST